MDNDQRKVAKEIGRDLAQIFKRYSTIARRRGWNAIMSVDGRKEVDKLINNPNRTLNGFNTLTFREWLEQENNDL